MRSEMLYIKRGANMKVETEITKESGDHIIEFLLKFEQVHVQIGVSKN